MRNWYLSSIIISCVISWILWGVVLFFIAPEDLGFIGVILFVATLGAAFFTSSFVALYALRIRFLKLTPVFRQFHIIFRESVFLGIAPLILLILSHHQVLTFLNSGLLFVALIFLEIFFIVNYDKRRYQKVRENV